MKCNSCEREILEGESHVLAGDTAEPESLVRTCLECVALLPPARAAAVGYCHSCLKQIMSGDGHLIDMDSEKRHRIRCIDCFEQT